MLFAFRDLIGYSPLVYFIMTLFLIVIVVVSLVLHELAHGYVALWNGDATAKYEGRLTLNPLKHFDIVGLIMMLAVGFGYAKPVPVNPYNFKHRTRGQFLVSIAGVSMNFILALVSALLCDLMKLWYVLADYPTAVWYFMQLFSMSVSINLSLAFFNLLPIYPLDGFRIVETFAHQGNKFCRFMRSNGQFVLWGLVGLSFIIRMALNYIPAELDWIGYFDVLGTYINFFAGNTATGFLNFWALMMPPISPLNL